MDLNTTYFLAGLFVSVFIFSGCERINPERQLLVRTGSASSITYNSCMLSGELIDIREDVIQHGFCFNLTGNPTVQVSSVNENSMNLGSQSSTGTFSGRLSELEAETGYFVRAYATDSEGTVYGDEISFTTAEAPVTPPTVKTTIVTDITGISALGGGNIGSNGGAEVTARGICWSLAKDPTLDDESTRDGRGTGLFKSDLTGLYCGETYYVRAYATNSAGTAYGSQLSFTTSGCTKLTSLLVKDNDGIWVINDNGTKSLAIGGSGEIEILEGWIYYAHYTAVNIYNSDFSLYTSYSIGTGITTGELCALSGGKVAFLSNNTDSVYFLGSTGNLEKRVSITGREPDDNLQSLQGLVVDNRLIVSEDGEKHIMQFDLSSYARSEFKNFEHLSGWLGDITYSNERFYMVQSRKVYSFREDEKEHLVCTLPEGNNTGIAVHGKYAYVTSNFGNKVYRVNLVSGSYEIFFDDLNYPQDIELME
jgi:hypothetical protein